MVRTSLLGGARRPERRSRRGHGAIIVPATPREVWTALTAAEGWKTWAVPVAYADFRLGGIIETSYQPGAAQGDHANIKNKILSSFDTNFGFTHLDMESGRELSFNLGHIYNTENDDTDYRSGRMLHFDASLQQMIKAGSGFMTVGLSAFLGNQISDDKNQGRLVGPFQTKTAGIGPAIGYLFPMGKDNIVVEFRWLPQLDTKNTTEGDYYWLKFVYQLGTGKK